MLFSLYRYFKAQWVQLTLLGMENAGKRLRKYQSTNIKEMRSVACTWDAHYFSQKEFPSLRGHFIPQKERSQDLQTLRRPSCKSCLFSAVEDGLPFLKKKKMLEEVDLNIAHWHVHEKGLDDISFKCLLSVPNKTVTVTFLGCCSLGYSLLIVSQTFECQWKLAFLRKMVSLTKPEFMVVN